VRDETIARNYASALFELAESDGELEAYRQHVQTLGVILREDPQILHFLETPRVEVAEKKRVIRTSLGPHFPKAFVNFVLVTLDKRRQGILPDIVREWENLFDEHLNRVHVELTVARQPDEDTLRTIVARLSELLGKEAIPQLRVRPEILGGIIARTGDTVYDGSIRRRLERMRRRLLAAPLPGGLTDVSDVQSAKAMS
jgi:F-type H+-transporting ATPase subunit delta